MQWALTARVEKKDQERCQASFSRCDEKLKRIKGQRNREWNIGQKERKPARAEHFHGFGSAAPISIPKESIPHSESYRTPDLVKMVGHRKPKTNRIYYSV